MTARLTVLEKLDQPHYDALFLNAEGAIDHEYLKARAARLAQAVWGNRQAPPSEVRHWIQQLTIVAERVEREAQPAVTEEPFDNAAWLGRVRDDLAKHGCE